MLAGFSFPTDRCPGVTISEANQDSLQDDLIEVAEPLPRYQGTVKWFSPDKGYGFIEVVNQHHIKGKKDFFVHYQGIRGHGWRNLKEGQVVDFEIVKGPNGDQANDTFIVSEPEAPTEVA